MSLELPENSQTGIQKESPIPALREELENLIDTEARQRLEQYVSGLPTGTLHGWLGDHATELMKNDDPTELVIDLSRQICETAAASGPFLFSDPDKDKIKDVKKKAGIIKRQLNGSLTILKKS